MLLLNVNIPLAVKAFLEAQGLKADTAESRGWRELENGDLVSAAMKAGFRCLLTRDKRIANSAAKALSHFPEFSIIILVIAQVKEPQYLKNFEEAWKKSPLKPASGKVLDWPTSVLG